MQVFFGENKMVMMADTTSDQFHPSAFDLRVTEASKYLHPSLRAILVLRDF